MKLAPGVVLAIASLLLAPGASAQRQLAGAAKTRLAIERLLKPARVLMIAAHPDDENTALLAWLARGQNVRAAYLSITRGEGGQNLIGSEQGRLLGLIRTEELLAARRIDGAEQFFTTAVDFGFSKTAEETFAKWGREKVLGEIVLCIRRFRPDVIVLRFSGTERDGHGHHQASAILGKEAFFAAADPLRFPEQLSEVKPWKATRVVWNAFSWTRQQEQEVAAMPGRIEVDLGEYDPLLGFSFSEIAGMSRSEHRSQAMGSPETRGSVKNYLVHVAGEPAKSSMFDGVQTERDLPALKAAYDKFDPRAPHKTIPALIEARKVLGEEVDEAIALCAGLWIDVSAERPMATSGSKVGLTVTAVNRSHASVVMEGKPLAYNQRDVRKVELNVRDGTPEPVELRPVVEGQEIVLRRPVQHRYIDPVRGELKRPFVVVPPVSVRLAETARVFGSAAPRDVNVQVKSYAGKQSGDVRLELPAEWRVTPASAKFDLEEGQESTARFQVTPPSKDASVRAKAVANGVSTNVITLDYPHIPTQVVFEPAETRVVRADVKIAGRRVGYVMGAGDEIPEALRQIGYEVTLLSPEQVAQWDLHQFDAVVAGVRAYNTRPDLRANHHRLMRYVEDGGTVVVQYNVLERGSTLQGLGPYPFKVGRDRVTVEEAPVTVLRSDHPFMTAPNKLSASDFEGWVQERGLYFASEWDPRYETVLATGDPGEKPLAGGLLYARHGKGAYVFTAYSWFRQLPAGVPGAYRIFANLLSAGKTR